MADMPQPPLLPSGEQALQKAIRTSITEAKNFKHTMDKTRDKRVAAYMLIKYGRALVYYNASGNKSALHQFACQLVNFHNQCIQYTNGPVGVVVQRILAMMLLFYQTIAIPHLAQSLQVCESAAKKGRAAEHDPLAKTLNVSYHYVKAMELWYESDKQLATLREKFPRAARAALEADDCCKNVFDATQSMYVTLHYLEVCLQRIP